MPSNAVSREIKTISPDDAFQETLSQLPDLGYIIWKTRPLAWLVIANRELPEGKVNATISFRPGDGAVVSISLASETISEKRLQELATELVEALVIKFGAGAN
jgi:hypothetical protein